MNRTLVVGVLACLAFTGCAAQQQPSTTSARTPVASPTPVTGVGKVGTAVTVAQEPASATVVINKVRYAPSPDGMPAMAILDVTITGLTDAPYTYSDQQFAYIPGGKRDWTPSPSEDYTRFMPPAPLRSGTVTKGKAANGILILRGPTGDGTTTVAFASGEPSRDFRPTIEWML